jgi:hypothetical protein
MRGARLRSPAGWGLAVLVLLVVLLHGLALDGLSRALALADPATPSIARIEATYTRVGAQSAAPTGPPVAPVVKRPKRRPAAAQPAATRV